MIKETLEREYVAGELTIVEMPHKYHKFSKHKRHMISALIWLIGRKESYYSYMGVRFKLLSKAVDNLWVSFATGKIVYAFMIDGDVTESSIRALRKVKAQYRVLVSTGKNRSRITSLAKRLGLDKHGIHHIIV